MVAPNAQAAAILLMLLPEEDAAAIVTHLSPVAIEALGSAMVGLAGVDEPRVADALDAFVVGARAGGGVPDDVEGHVDAVLRRALPSARADEMIGRIVPEGSSDPLPTLKWLSVADLRALADSEHPQFVAMIVAHLAPDRAAALLDGLDEAAQADILYRAATLGPVSPPAFAEADALLADALGSGRGAPRAAAVRAPTIAAILNHAPKPLEGKLLRALAKRDKALAARIEDDMLVFDDLLGLDDRALGTVMRGVDSGALTLALRTLDEAQRERIFATMSARAADTMRDAIADAARVPLSEVQTAQRTIVAIARTLADNGEIMLGKGSADYV